MQRQSAARSMWIAMWIAMWVASLAVQFFSVSRAGADENDEEHSRNLFIEAGKLYDNGDKQGALARYRESYERVPRAKTLLNIGALLSEMDRRVEAATILAKYLIDANADRDKLPAVRRLLDSLDRKIGRLELTVKREGRVTLDGDRVGTGPLREMFRLEPGNHTVSVGKEARPLELRPGLVVQMQFEPMRSGSIVDPRASSKFRESDVTVDSGSTDSSSVFTHPALWTSVLTLAAGSAGVGFGLAARAAESDLEKKNKQATNPDQAGPFSDAQKLEDKARSRALYANIGFGVAGAAAIASVVLWFVVDGESANSEPVDEGSARAANSTQLVPVLSREHVGVSLNLRF